MLIAFFDTETTGFKPREDRICQFWAIIGTYIDWKFYEERRINQYFQIDREVPEGAAAINGLSKEFLSKFKPIDEYMREILYWFNKADLIVAHNFSFDSKMMQGEYELWKEKWVGIEKYQDVLSWTNKLSICTMKQCWYKKRPKLQQLHTDLFCEEFDGAHDAMADILATKKCFFELMNKGIISL